MALHKDALGTSVYKYEPKSDDLIERCPDKLAATPPPYLSDKGAIVTWAFAVKGLGAFTLRTVDGQFVGMANFTSDDIQFDNDVIGDELYPDVPHPF